MQRFRIEKYLQHNVRGFWSLDRSRSDEKSQRFPQAPGGSDAGLYCPWYSDATLRGSATDYCRAELLWSMPKLHEKHRQAQITKKSQLARSWLLQNSQVFVSTEHCLFICCCDSMPTSPEVQNYKTPLPARDATCSNSAATRAFWPVKQNISPRFARWKHPHSNSAKIEAGAKFKKWIVCSELVIFYLWLESYIYIYILWNILCRFIESYAHSLASEPRMLPRIFCFHSLETKDQFKLPPNGQKGRLTTLDTTGSHEVRGTSKFFCCTCLSCLIGASGGLCLDFLLTETGEWPVPCSIESFMIWSESERCAVEALIGRLEWDIVSWL